MRGGCSVHSSQSANRLAKLLKRCLLLVQIGSTWLSAQLVTLVHRSLYEPPEYPGLAHLIESAGSKPGSLRCLSYRCFGASNSCFNLSPLLQSYNNLHRRSKIFRTFLSLLLIAALAHTPHLFLCGTVKDPTTS